MLLAHAFAEPQLNLALEVFLRVTRDLLGDRLASVILYGSILFDDLAPGYGDLTDADREALTEARRPLRNGAYGIYAHLLEGAFLPRHMLDPERAGRALWWGTTRERPWERSELGWLVLHVIRERGVVLWGEDIRPEIPPASREALLADVRAAIRSGKEHGCGGGLHSVDWLLTAARLLLWVREGHPSSKSEAAEWGRVHAVGAWRELLPRAAEVRRNPHLVGEPDTRIWLAGLTGPIRDAYRELEDAL